MTLNDEDNDDGSMTFMQSFTTFLKSFSSPSCSYAELVPEGSTITITDYLLPTD
jgi:hypothetical protein